MSEEEVPEVPVLDQTTELSPLLNEPDLLVETCIDAIHQHLCNNKEERPTKSSVITIQSVTLIVHQLSDNSISEAPPSQETLLKLVQIMVFYTQIGSEGAIRAAKLLSKLVKAPFPCEDIVRLICSEITSVIEKKQGNQRVNYYCLVLKMFLTRCRITEEFFMEVVYPVMCALSDDGEGGQGRGHVIVLAKIIQFEWLIDTDLMWAGLYKDGFLRDVLKTIELKTCQLSEDKFNVICRRVSELDAKEFDDFISILFEYLIHWPEKRNFETLGVIVDFLDIILGIAPPSVTSEITTGLKSIDLWHVKLIVCWELFGEPVEELNIDEKSESTIPLELYLNFKMNSTPSESLLERIYSIKDEITYKFCFVVLQQLFNAEDLTNFEIDMEEITEKVKALKSTHGSKCLHRIRRVLSQELKHAAP